MTKTTLVYKTVTFPGLDELVGLWEQIQRQGSGWGCSGWGWCLAWATTTLLKQNSTSLCQVLVRLCSVLIELYGLSDRHSYLGTNRESPRYLQVNIGFPHKDRQPSKCFCTPGRRKTVVGPWFGRKSSVCFVGQWSCHANSILVRSLVYWGVCRRRLTGCNPPSATLAMLLNGLSAVLVKKGNQLQRAETVFSCSSTCKPVCQNCREEGILMESPPVLPPGNQGPLLWFWDEAPVTACNKHGALLTTGVCACCYAGCLCAQLAEEPGFLSFISSHALETALAMRWRWKRLRPAFLLPELQREISRVSLEKKAFWGKINQTLRLS